MLSLGNTKHSNRILFNYCKITHFFENVLILNLDIMLEIIILKVFSTQIYNLETWHDQKYICKYIKIFFLKHSWTKCKSLELGGLRLYWQGSEANVDDKVGLLVLRYSETKSKTLKQGRPKLNWQYHEVSDDHKMRHFRNQLYNLESWCV